MKAVNGGDVVFTDKKNRPEKGSYCRDDVETSKNRQNGQKIRWVVDKDHPKTYNVIALTNMAVRKYKLKHVMDLPLAVYRDSKGKVWYRTRAKATEVIRRVVKAVYPDSSKDELLCYRI